MPPKTSADLTKPHCYPNLTNISQYRKGWLFAYPRQPTTLGERGARTRKRRHRRRHHPGHATASGHEHHPTTMHGEPGPTPEAPP